MPSNNTFQFRRGSGSLWLSTNPVLASGEPGFDLTNNLLKIGNGVTSWSGLNPVNISGVEFNTAVSGLLPVKNIVAGSGIAISSTSGIFTVSSNVSGVQESQSIVTTVFNKTGSGIPKFTVVYINGGQGDQPTVELAIANGESGSSKTYGITSEAISNMQTGRVISFGLLSGVNTDQFNPTAPVGDVNGTTLYLSPTISGGMTTTKPSAPDHMVSVAKIVRTHQNAGVVAVNIQNGFELGELHNVRVNGTSGGSFLQYNSSSGLWLASTSGNFSMLQVSGTAVPTGVGFSNSFSLWSNTSSLTSGSIYQQDYYTDKWIGIGTGVPSCKVEIYALEGDNILRQRGEVGGAWIALQPHDPYSPNNLYWGLGAETQDNNYTVWIGSRGENNSIDKVSIYTKVSGAAGNPIERFTVTSSGITINDPGTGIDVRIEGTTDQNLFFTQAATNRIGIGTNSPSQKLHVVGTGYITNKLGIGTASPTHDLHVVGSANITGDVVVGGNVTINGTTTTINVDKMEIEDPIITLGMASGNIITDTNLDRGLALILSTGVTAFMGWDKSENEFSFLSSGVATSSSGIYSPGTYGNIHAAGFIGTSGNFSNGLAISGSATINGTGIVAGAGTSGYLAKWNGSSTITGSTNIYETGSNIGIGTTTPSGKLHVVENSVSNSNLIIENAAAGAGISLIMRYAGTPYSGLIINDWVGDGFVFQASRDLSDSQGGFVWKGNNGTSHMVLRTNGAGKLGLGTTAPLQKFDVRGNVYASGSMGIGGSSYSGNFPTNGLIVQGSVGIGTPSPTGTLHVNGSGFVGGTGIAPNATLHVYSSTSGNTVFNAEGTNGSLFSVVDNLSGALMSVNTIAGLPVFQVNSDYSISGGRFNRSDFVITSGGDIGIGTGIPVAKLHVNGTGIISSRLGIGTTSPQSFIHVSGASSGIGTLARFNNNVSSSGTYLDIRLGTPGNWDNHIFFQRNGVDFLGCSDTNTLYFPVTVNIEHGKVIQSNNNANAFIEPKRNSNNDFRIGFIDGGNLIFMASYVEKMRFTSSGNLGINTASPTAQLHVNGSGFFSSGLAVSGSLTLNNSGVLTTVGTGASGYLVKWGTNTSLTSGIIYESGSRIGIGLTNPAYTLQVSGSFGATTKSFNINHPSKPGYRLEYGSLESPYHGVRLTGRGKVVKGVGVVELPDYLKDLVHDDENLNIQLTNIKHNKVLYIDSINLNDNNFIVKADRAKTLGNLEFFWTLSAVRKDVERLVVERKE